MCLVSRDQVRLGSILKKGGGGACCGEACIRPISESRLKRDGLDPGTVAPPFRLSRIGGGQVSLEDYRGHRVLVVFSDPECEPCNELAPSLQWIHRRLGDYRVLMISRGSVDTNREQIDRHGLTFSVGLQRQWEVSRDYAMFATPIAYLINAEGVIEADVAVGVEAILALAQRRSSTMYAQILARLDALKHELEVGQRELDKVERDRTTLRETLLRISGAIQVLEELGSSDDASNHDSNGAVDSLASTVTPSEGDT